MVYKELYKAYKEVDNDCLLTFDLNIVRTLDRKLSEHEVESAQKLARRPYKQPGNCSQTTQQEGLRRTLHKRLLPMRRGPSKALARPYKAL